MLEIQRDNKSVFSTLLGLNFWIHDNVVGYKKTDVSEDVALIKSKLNGGSLDRLNSLLEPIYTKKGASIEYLRAISSEVESIINK